MADEDSPGQERTTGDWLYFRILSFFALVVLTEYWLSYHVAISFGSVGALSQITGAITVGLGILNKVLRKAQQEDLSSKITCVASKALSPAFLLIFAAAAVFVALTVSSIRIVSEGGPPLDASIMPVDSQQETLLKTSRAAPLVVGTTPFGRTYRIKVEGYLAETFQVMPFSGLRIRPSKDLRVSPSILLRPPRGALGSLESGGSVVVSLEQDGRLTRVAGFQKTRSSFLIGRKVSIPASLVELWKLELAREQEPNRSETLLEWMRPTVLKPSVELAPGMKLVAQVKSRVGKTVAEAHFVLGSDALNDIPLEMR